MGILKRINEAIAKHKEQSLEPIEAIVLIPKDYEELRIELGIVPEIKIKTLCEYPVLVRQSYLKSYLLSTVKSPTMEMI